VACLKILLTPRSPLNVDVYHHRFGRSCDIILSMSASALPLALLFSNSNALRSFAFSASSPALTIIPHFTHISILSATVRFVHFGMNVDASLVFPAPRIWVKNGYLSATTGYVSDCSLLSFSQVTCPVHLVLTAYEKRGVDDYEKDVTNLPPYR